MSSLLFNTRLGSLNNLISIIDRRQPVFADAGTAAEDGGAAAAAAGSSAAGRLSAVGCTGLGGHVEHCSQGHQKGNADAEKAGRQGQLDHRSWLPG